MISRILSGSRRTGLLFIAFAILTYFAVGITANKTVQADDLPVIHVSGTLEDDETWTSDSVYVVDSTVTIPNNTTLTIHPGTVVKYTYGSWNHGLTVAQGGTLAVEGTSGSSVIFTSINDDSRGGDSGNDGPTTGASGDYSIAILGEGGEINVEYADFYYGNEAFGSYCSPYNPTMSFTDSTFNSAVSYSYCTNVSFMRNHFNVPQNLNPIRANNADLSGLILSGSNKNTFSGTGKSIAIQSLEGKVPSNKSWVIDSSAGAVLNVRNVEVIGILTINAGVIVKVDNGGSNYGIKAKQGGTLNVDGTSGNPVVFTSMSDDSVGGDSANDGSTAGSPGDYNGAISGETGHVNVKHSIIRNGWGAVGISCWQGGSLSLADSILKSRVEASYCTGSSILNIKRNNFDISTGSSFYAIDISGSDVQGVALGGNDKNIISGNGLNKTVRIFDSFVPVSTTWTLEGSSGAILEARNNTINGTLNLGSGMLIKGMLANPSAPAIFMNNGSVNVAPDVIFKLNTSNEGIRVGEDAVLNIQGTGTSPVVFTSLKDDSIAGDTGEDGSTTGTAGDYGTAVNVAGDTAVEITNVDVRYAHTAFGATDGEVSLSNVLYGLVTHYADVVFRGSISNVTHKGIQACNWAPQWPCSVDAAYVDWGSADGPFPPSSPPLVCGRVTVSPWVVGSGTSNAETFDVPNCDNTATPNTLLSGSVTGFNNAVSDEQIDCSNGYQPACDAIEDAFACLGGAIQVAASTTPIPVSFTNPTQTSDTVHADAVAATDSFLQGLEIANPSSFSLGIASGISSVVNLFGALSNAYSNCAP